MLSFSMFKNILIKNNPRLLHLMNVGLFLSTHQKYANRRLTAHAYRCQTENFSERIMAPGGKRNIIAFFLCEFLYLHKEFE